MFDISSNAGRVGRLLSPYLPLSAPRFPRPVVSRFHSRRLPVRVLIPVWQPLSGIIHFRV